VQNCQQECRVCGDPFHPVVLCDSEDPAHIAEAKRLCKKNNTLFRGRDNDAARGMLQKRERKDKRRDPLRSVVRDKDVPRPAYAKKFTPEKTKRRRSGGHTSKLAETSSWYICTAADGEVVELYEEARLVPAFKCAKCGDDGYRVLPERVGHGMARQCTAPGCKTARAVLGQFPRMFRAANMSPRQAPRQAPARARAAWVA
jgi:hypothetical protein